MPWFHRGIAALRQQRADFLLDFGPEWWPMDVAAGKPSHWTVADLMKIVTNFVVVTKPALRDPNGTIVEPEVVSPLFELDYKDGVIHNVRIVNPKLLNAFMLPRGYSKTTLLNMLNYRDVCYGDAKFLVYVSETGTHAVNQLLTMRGQLETNELAILVFGDLRPDRSDSEKWTDNLIETNNGCRVGAVGRGGQLRGMSKDATRPTRIVIDDLQNEESVKSEAERTKDINWLLRTVLPARKIFGDDLTVIDMIGTLLHPEALMPLIMADPDWTAVRFGAFDRQGDALWEEMMPRKKVLELRASYERKGKLDIFDFEYMSSLPMNDGAAFPLDKITYVNRPSEWFVAKALVCDPAISKNPKADFCTFAALGMSKFGYIHVIDFYAEVGMEFDAQAEKYFELHFAHCLDLPPDQVRHGVEAVAYQQALVSTIGTKMHEKSKTWGPRAYFEVVPLLHGKTGKLIRVQGILSPRTKSGHVSMERPFGTLVSQLRDWPNGKLDGPDAVAMGIGMLDPYASVAANDANEDGEPINPQQQAMASAGLRVVQGPWRKAP
ncbi:putative large terminase [Caulobacter phage Kuura]|nr:putative large terminase [Caulobacter phage Kuura]